MAKASKTRVPPAGRVWPFLLALAVLAPGCAGPEKKQAGDPEEQRADLDHQHADPEGKQPGAAAQGPGEELARDDAQGADPQAEFPDAEADRESLSPPGLGLPGGVLGQAGATGAESEREMAQHFYEAGRRHFEELDYRRAYDALRRAIELDPAHAEATQLYREAGAILGVRQDELRANIERLRQERQVKVQLLRQEMTRFYESGEAAFNDGDYEQAIKDLERVVQIIAYSAYEIDPDEGERSFKARAERLIAEAKARRLQADLEDRYRRERDMIDRARREESDRLERESQRIQTMLEQATDLYAAQRYEDAEELADRILALEPHNSVAIKIRDLARIGFHYEADRDVHQRFLDEEWATWQGVEESAIPREGRFIDFPDDWPERTRDRHPGIGTIDTEDPVWIQNVKKILADRQVTLNFTDVALSDVVMFLQDITNLNFAISPDVDADGLRVDVRLRDIKLENALQIILDQVGLTYIFDREVIMIVEPGADQGETFFEIYDVSDLLFNIPDFTGPRMTLPDPDRDAAGGGGSLIFGDMDDMADEPLDGDRLADIVRGATGGDDVWWDRMSMEPHKGQLLVTATREIHMRVLDVLDNIRQNQGWFVHIETRFIEMTNDMLEDLGIDFRGLGSSADATIIGDEIDAFAADPNFPGRNLGGTDVGTARRGSQPIGGGPGTDNFVSRTQHFFGDSAGPAFGRRLQGGGGMTLQLSILDPFQMNAILRAEHQSEKVRQLTAPRVTAANRERVYIQHVVQRAYIADWDLISGGTGLEVVEVPDPTIETLQEGVVLEVRPTISHDRKYVTLDCRPSLAQLVGGQINTVTVNLGSLSMTAIAVPIGVPEITLQEAFTSVTIPDGGTALLGGFRQLREREEISTMPIVEHIPLLNLLFRRRAQTREMSSLVILVTARVISMRDEERKRFNRDD